ncbi:ribonuclease HI family protein [Areca yellow leaf disease phytoplasma]|uniref:ribonuclease HI family protein n=1 Tax=Areca yellow leaf disease phytoplasma TaxID=927614 RepID=UPI0035B56EA9
MKERWTLHVDGSSSSSRFEVGLILAHLEREVVEYALRLSFPTTNNKVEYEALHVRLKITKELRVGHLTICSNSQLMVGQVKDEYEVHEENMKKYLAKTKELTK